MNQVKRNYHLSRGISEDILDSLIETSGVYVPDHWIPYINELHTKLKQLAPDYVILQIKEKFGTLRYYVMDATEEGDKLISDYERESKNWGGW